MSNERYDELELLAQDLESQMSPIATSSIEYVSRVACRWGLQSDFKGLLVQLLLFQTRHYARYVSNEVDNK
ncbi:hypothetical protein VCRA2126E14_20175 [Vibrio crassostreae]|nr:hypothetical protein VCRA2110O2_20192 [Vibrio crassostreae]CAK3500536.1 hypothetical protein VCRA2126E14_20175 [Vibrio crassostreae]